MGQDLETELNIGRWNFNKLSWTLGTNVRVNRIAVVRFFLGIYIKGHGQVRSHVDCCSLLTHSPLDSASLERRTQSTPAHPRGGGWIEQIKTENRHYRSRITDIFHHHQRFC